MSWIGNIAGRLYRGEVSFDFVGRRRLWYTISGLILVISLAALFGRGLNESVDFKGGSVFLFKAPAASQAQIRSTVAAAGGGPDTVIQTVGLGSHASWQVQTAKLSFPEQVKVQNAIAADLHPIGGAKAISSTFIGPTWGSQISQKALEALIAFLVVIVIYLSIAFEWKMATAALVALAHDIVITIGVYALAGFQVSPATVIGLLTILGYSLYDTVVVFDKVRENTAGLLGTSRTTYSQAANLALNQTLVRSINTSLIALLPVAAILVTGIYPARPRRARGPGARAVRRHAVRNLLLDLHRHAGAGRTQGARAAVQGAGASGSRCAPRAAGQHSGPRPRRRRPGRPPAAPVPAAAAEPGQAADDDEAATDAGAFADQGRTSASRGASRCRGAARRLGARPGPRQQPRRTSAAKRRPAGKKKRR